ncbi:hypothetical protein ANN_20894, partial [Periplaneta americana]
RVFVIADCGVQIITDGRVVGGEDVGGYKIPWFALLHPPGDKTTPICSGCLIDTNHVVTAAHCFTLVSGDNNTAKFGVTLGIYDRCANESSQQTFVVKNVTLHPKFTSPTGNYDIAIITLDEPATNFTPICLPGKAERNVTHRVGEILGFGEMAEDNSTTMPCKLQKAYLQIFGKEQCGRFDLPSHVTNPRVLCAGVVGGGVDSCQVVQHHCHYERIPNLSAEQSDGITVFRISPMASLISTGCHQLAEVVAVSISRHQ